MATIPTYQYVFTITIQTMPLKVNITMHSFFAFFLCNFRCIIFML